MTYEARVSRILRVLEPGDSGRVRAHVCVCVCVFYFVRYASRLWHESEMKLAKTHYVRKRFYALLHVYLTIYAAVLLINILSFKYLTSDYTTQYCYYYYYELTVTINYYVTAV